MTRNSEAGFTLIELLVSVTLMAMLSLLLFGGLHFGTRVWEKATAAETIGNKVLVAQQSVSDAVKEIYPFFVLASASDRHIQFDGEPSQLTFFAPAHAGGLDVVTILRDPNGSLVINSRPELATNVQANITHRVLLGNVTSFSVSYFGAMTRNDPQQWQGSWHNARALPDLVRIRATVKGAVWPDLVVTPWLSADQSCVYDQLTKYCTGRL